jgi:hypothetical protein
VTDQSLLPLEEAAKKLLTERRNELPDRNADYWARYTHLLAGLREHVYPHVNAGLSCLSKSPGIYTDHGPDHFDEVVRYAGLLLGLPSDRDLIFTPYEIYLLLCAIRLHDAGNIDGREEHEKRVRPMLELYGGNICHDQAEATLICEIAQAHGGRTLKDDKDTIGQLQDETVVAAISCRPRQVAALVRFADEICEHHCRAARHHINADTLPADNRLFHYYAVSVTGAQPHPTKSFRLRLTINTKYLLQKYPTPPDASGKRGEKFLIDDVLDRISKLDLERRYCNQYLDHKLQTTELDILITLNEDQQIEGSRTMPVSVASYPILISSRQGYPTANDRWRREVSEELNGYNLAEHAKRGWK